MLEKRRLGEGEGGGSRAWGGGSRPRNWCVHSRRIWIRPPARKQNCAFDSRGRVKGKLDIKACFKKRNGAEGIQGSHSKLGRPEVLSRGPDRWGSQGQNSQWKAGLLVCYFKGKMFTGHSRKWRGEISLSP